VLGLWRALTSGAGSFLARAVILTNCFLSAPQMRSALLPRRSVLSNRRFLSDTGPALRAYARAPKPER